mmetsp:Transcript_10311/g.32682  ORF Transcript_10311/g.32682 Transcript_10311/m.32682 type:complete len:388 (+) Transcript_10311:30-1193(+)
MAVPTLALKSALVGFVLYTAYAGTMRTRESALSYRLSRFYEAHGIAKRQPDTRKLLHRHGSVEGVERELRKKYGDWLPPEDLSVLPLADDTVGTAVYLLSGALADRAPPWLSQLSDADWKRLPGAGLVQRWEAAPTAARLGYSAVGCSALRLALPESMRLPAILAFGALAWSVRPTPEELSPISLWRELVAAWDGGASAPEEPRALPRRLAICSGVALVVAAAAGPSHSLPVLLALLLAALCVSVPETADTWESMPIVAPSARSALRSALKQKPDLLQQHEVGVLAYVTIDAEHTGWQAPLLAIGALGRWVPLGTISATGAADGQRKLEVSGRLLPAAAIPAALFLLTGLAAALNSDGHLSLPARSARAALLLFSLASIVAAAATWM